MLLNSHLKKKIIYWRKETKKIFKKCSNTKLWLMHITSQMKKESSALHSYCIHGDHNNKSTNEYYVYS
jgi:hypothetical protein